ncbi:MAG: class I SAM-dependent methyltransferase [Promethearchaeota archaeon]
MKKEPEYKILDDPEVAKVYAASAAKRNKRIAKIHVDSLSKLGFKKGRILEAGCGSGDIAIELTRAFPEAEVIGLDLSEPLLEMAQKSAEEAGLSDRCSFKKGNLEAMPFEDDSFDIVVTLNTLHVLDNPVAMLDEIERVLAPSGILQLSDIKRSRLLGLILPILKTAYSETEAKEILNRSKLRPWEFAQGTYWWGVRTGRLTDSQ